MSRQAINAVRAYLNEQVLGQPELVDGLMTALLADGHILVEGPPGLAKTRAIKMLANCIERRFHRIQFTPDLLPADLTGTDIYRPQDGSFVFQPGPLFHHLLLADEINRAPAKVQSALLEAMAEHQVTIDGTTRPLPAPFFVIATQNPVALSGTYPLPDPQLDRFLLRLSMGYPSADAERALLTGEDRRALIAQAKPLLDEAEVLSLQQAVSNVHASEALIGYVQALLARSRQHPGVRIGLSPRAGLALLRAARAHALLLGRGHALPEDVQALFLPLAAHRLVGDGDAGDGAQLAKSVLLAVPVD